jgi:hypothetical protein
MTVLSSNQYTVYANFTDILGNTSNTLASDTIYNQIQQQANNQATPSGTIVEINPYVNSNNLNSYVPPEGSSNFIYAGSKIVISSGVFEADPYYASDVVSWSQIQVLAFVPGVTPSSATQTHGTSVTLYVKSASSLSALEAETYTNSYTVSTINNGANYGTNIASILANISGLSGNWIQFKLVLQSASQGITPTVQSVLLTYVGAGRSVFVTKTFNTSSQSSITPAPLVRRGILTANFATNGGQIVFGYTTDPTNGNPLNYTTITPNQIFTLATPSSTIKFGVILKTASTLPCFFDEFALQLDLGNQNVYYMPPQASFVVTPYYNSSGVRVQNAYQFTNKSIGIVSSYNWNFGTSFGVGILTYYPIGINTITSPPQNSQNPIVGFATTALQTVGLFITGWVENGIVFNSDAYTYSFIST